MWTRFPTRCLSLAVAAGLWTVTAEQLPAQSKVAVPIQVVPLERSIFQEILDSDPYDMPVLVRHRQDPNPLRPNDALQMAPQQNTPGSQTARNLLGIPQRNEQLARRGRLRTIAMSQNRAAPMIGDFFGASGTSLTLTPTIGEVVPFAHTPSTGTDFNGFVTARPPNDFDGPFFGGTVAIDNLGNAIYPQLSVIGRDTDNDNLADTFSGLKQYTFFDNDTTIPPGGGAPVVENDGPFTAVLAPGKTVVVNGNTLPVLALQQNITLKDIPSPSTGGIVGVGKMAENTSPMPRDRVFFNYSYFNNVPFTANGINLNRFTPGFEKTFGEGTSSVEVRLPFATTLDSNISADGLSDGEQLEFGNVSIVLKSLLYRDDEFAISGGLQTALPSADPINVNLADGTTVFQVKNQSVHLMPFVGALFTPNDRLFSQAYMQFDFVANGNDVMANLDLTKLRQVGTVQDNTFLYLDWSAGYWTYLAEDESAFLTGVAPMVELHFNQSLQGRDVIRGPGNFQLGTPGRNYSVLNAVIGTTFQFGSQSALTIGYAAPIGSGVDQQFDGEFRMFFNRRFGPQTRQTRAI